MKKIISKNYNYYPLIIYTIIIVFVIIVAANNDRQKKCISVNTGVIHDRLRKRIEFRFVVARNSEVVCLVALEDDTAGECPRLRPFLQGGARMIYSVMQHPHHALVAIRTGPHSTPTVQNNARTYSLLSWLTDSPIHPLSPPTAAVIPLSLAAGSFGRHLPRCLCSVATLLTLVTAVAAARTALLARPLFFFLCFLFYIFFVFYVVGLTLKVFEDIFRRQFTNDKVFDTTFKASRR